MAAALKKQQELDVSTAQPMPEAETVSVNAPELRAESKAAAGSPALALQARLETELKRSDKVSARHVTATFLVVCLATWLAGFMLYATL